MPNRVLLLSPVWITKQLFFGSKPVSDSRPTRGCRLTPRIQPNETLLRARV